MPAILGKFWIQIISHIVTWCIRMICTKITKTCTAQIWVAKLCTENIKIIFSDTVYSHHSNGICYIISHLQWRRGMGQKVNCPHPWILGCRKIAGTSSTCQKILVQNSGLKTIWGNSGAKLKFWTPRRKFASVCRNSVIICSVFWKIATSWPNDDIADHLCCRGVKVTLLRKGIYLYWATRARSPHPCCRSSLLSNGAHSLVAVAFPNSLPFPYFFLFPRFPRMQCMVTTASLNAKTSRLTNILPYFYDCYSICSWVYMVQTALLL